ncbi:MAG: hypothetical protein QW331_01200 [Candidatus Woesearchaeota archaeon]
MKSIVFDTGPLISLATNNLLWILKPLKERFGGEFYITKRVKQELIDTPLRIKRFELEAMQVWQCIKDGTISIIENPEIHKIERKMLQLANTSFKAKGTWIKIVHEAEMESVAAAIFLGSSAVVVDERTTRVLIENSPKLTEIFERKLQTSVEFDKNNIKEFKKIFNEVKIIRSVELITVAYKLGLLKDYVLGSDIVDHPKERLLNAALWALKIRGCSISREEIEQIVSENA